MELDLHHFQPMAKAFYWTLIHSLWQGLIVALLTAIILLLTSKSRPSLRYNLFAGLLLGFFLINVATFLIVFEKEVADSGSSVLRKISIETAAYVPNDFIKQDVSASFTKAVTTFLNHYQAQIILGWLIVFLFKSSRTVTGLVYIHKLRHTSANPISETWNWRLRQLAAKMGVYGQVLLLESAALKAPMLQGFLRPVIIVPLGFLTSLPQEQVEAILLHELAHVRRQDYLVNLLQSLGENLYFFNPAFLWLSSLTRIERENCCDDLVIRLTKEPATLVQALVSFQESRFAAPSPGLSFIGTGNHLLNRIKRIIYNTNKQLNTMEKFSITSSLIALAFISATYLTPIKPTNASLVTVNAQKPTIKEKSNPPMIKAEVETAVLVVKPVLPAQKTRITDSLPNIKELLTELRTAIDAKDLKKAQALHYQAYLLVGEEKGEIRSKTVETKLLANAFEKRKEQMAGKPVLVDVQNKMVSSSSESLAKRSAEIDALSQEMETLERENRQNRKAREAEMQENMINDLLAEGVITTRENLSYKLHNMFLIVNGVEQPATLHQKLKAKYLERSWTEWVYNWDGVTGLRLTSVRYNG